MTVLNSCTALSRLLAANNLAFRLILPDFLGRENHNETECVSDPAANEADFIDLGAELAGAHC